MSFLFVTVILPLFKEVLCGCGYDSCTQTKQGVLNVHIVPHSHDDVGWVQTFDEYYEGPVRRILYSVVNSLLKDSKRRFMYVETAFFWRWWGDQHEQVKDQVRFLVKEGRLKFIGGAWTMNDEATTHYQSIIDQFTWGLKKLNETFGACATPKVAWQIDPFGHSREFASLLAAMGYDGVFLSRIDFKELKERRKNQTMELIWRGDDDLGSSSDIFTGILYDHYSAPRGFNFEKYNMSANVEVKVETFYRRIKLFSKSYKTSNILIAMGDDFAYTNAEVWFRNLDILINSLNKKYENKKINLLYSTPDCYLKALKDENPTLPVKNDDFFPYANEFGYWTGYYTSRPTLKYFERDGNRFLQMMKQLYVIAGLDHDRDRCDIDELRSAMGIMQHHDAITGTEKQYVAEDYKKILNKAVDNSLFIANKAYNKFAASHSGTNLTKLFKFNRCNLNQSECTTSETSKNFIITVYNPLAWELFDVDVVVPVSEAEYVVYNSYGEIVEAELVPILEWYLKYVPARLSIATHELKFKVKRLAPLSFEGFYIYKIRNICHTNHHNLKKSATYDENKLLAYGSSIVSYIESGYYKSFRSGAYTFHSESKEPILWYKTTFKNIFTNKKNVRSNVTAVLRKIIKYGNSTVLQIQWLCDPIYISGVEVIVRYETNILNKGIFYTDSNGRQMIKRTLLENKNNVSANYYPVTSRIFIADNKTRFTVFTDRSEGGYSPKEGTIELMINRKLIQNKYQSAMGLTEALNEENLVTVVNHFIMLPNINQKQNVVDEKRFNFEVNMAPIILFADAKNITLPKWIKIKLSKEGLKNSFPKGLHLLTLEPWGNSRLLLRLENYLERSDRPNTAIEIDLCHIFTTFTILSMRETTLAANQWLDENTRMVWKTKENNFEVSDEGNGAKQNTRNARKNNNNGFKCANITLYAKQIRTFIAIYKMIP